MPVAMSSHKCAIFVQLKANGGNLLILIPKLKSLLYSSQHFPWIILKTCLLVMAEVHTHIIQKNHIHTSKFKYKNSNDNE